LTTLLEQPVETTNTSFNDFNLPSFLREGLKRLGFVSPTGIQSEAIPTLMTGQDLIAQSQTGSGKTGAFAIPMLARVTRNSRELQALVMVPTRELCLQVTNVVKQMAGPAVRVTPIYGGASMGGQIRGLSQGGYQVVIGTPGRLRDHLNRGTLRLDKLRMVVLDEADEMLDRGFVQDIEAILEAAPPVAQRQTALFSATLPEWVMETAVRQLKPGHASITISPEGQGLDIEHRIYDMKLPDKTVALRHLLDTNPDESILVFARTKHGVKKLAARLQEEGYSADGLQGNLSQRAREDVMAAFRHRRIRVLVATNVGARGLDVSGISHVINFDLPESPELFTHRVGRTGRNGASGIAITFLTGEDRLKWREIERSMKEAGIDYTRMPWDGPRATPGATDTVIIQPRPGEFRRSLGAPGRKFDGGREYGSDFDKPRRFEGERDRSDFGSPRRFEGDRERGNDFGAPRRFEGDRERRQERDFGAPRRFEKRDNPRDFAATRFEGEAEPGNGVFQPRRYDRASERKGNFGPGKRFDRPGNNNSRQEREFGKPRRFENNDRGGFKGGRNSKFKRDF
jgi:ATP-dependent RNA helicase DeaD